MSRFSQLWSREPTLQLAESARAIAVVHGNMMRFCHREPLQPLEFGIEAHDAPATTRDRDFVVEMRPIIDPPDTTEFDEIESDYDIRCNEHRCWRRRIVGIWDLRQGDPEHVAERVRDIVGALGHYGFIPEDPEIIHREWCNAVQQRAPDGNARAIRDCWRPFYGRDPHLRDYWELHHLTLRAMDVSRFSLEWLRNERRQSLLRHRGNIRLMCQDMAMWSDPASRAALIERASVLMREAGEAVRVAENTIDFSQFRTAGDPMLSAARSVAAQAMRDNVTPDEAVMRAIIIPITHNGPRAVNLEDDTNEVREPEHTPRRVYIS